MNPAAISLFLGYFLAVHPSSSTPATEDLLWCQVAEEPAALKVLSYSIYRESLEGHTLTPTPLPASKCVLWNPLTV